MTDFVTVEPAHGKRPEFALWCLAQEPQLMTSSASGFDVPLDLYPSVPPELLEGAYVDGFLYDRPEPVAPMREAVSAPVTPRETGTEGSRSGTEGSRSGTARKSRAPRTRKVSQE